MGGPPPVGHRAFTNHHCGSVVQCGRASRFPDFKQTAAATRVSIGENSRQRKR